MFPSPQQKTQSFLKIIEAGDLALYEPFPEALAVFGFTKAGKTSTCHILANSTLKAELKNGDLIYRPVSTVRFVTAKVGLTNESQTEIPNVFEANFKDKTNTQIKMAILDQPGYGDSYGFHRIFSNGYFHYRTLSKTPKLKFLIVLERKDLSGVAQKLKKVVFLFINSFTPYDSLKSEILKATCFLISKAEVGTKLPDIVNILTTLRDTMGGMTAKNRAYFQEFLNNMIDNNKLFLIEKPRAAGNETQSNTILQSIFERTQYWERKMNGVCADMGNVNFSVALEVLSELSSLKDNELFNEDFDAFMVEIKHKINSLLKSNGHPSSLKNIVSQLALDALADSQSCNFLDGMASFINEYYNFNPTFKDKREKLEATLFQITDNPELNDSRREISSPLKRTNEDRLKEKERKEADRRMLYFIKKFNVLSYIASEAKRLMDEDYQIFNRRNHQTLERLSAFFVDIFRKFDSLRSDRKGYEKTISRYCYIIQRLIDESKIMIQILFSNDETRDKFINLKQQLILDAEILFPISEIITYFEGIPVEEMKKEYIEKLDLDNLGFPINKEVIEFFESVPHLHLETQVKIARLLLRYNSDLANNKKVNLHDEMQFIGEKLLKYHELFAFKYNTENKQLKDILAEILFLITKAIADLLAKNSYHEPARNVLRTINDAQGIFQLYESQLKNLQSNDPSSRNLYIEYAKTAAYYQRHELATRCCQQAYTRATNLAEMKSASKLLIEVTTKQPEDTKVEYLSKLFSEEFCERLSSDLSDMIKLALNIQEY